jgi:hypothetical protein
LSVLLRSAIVLSALLRLATVLSALPVVRRVKIQRGNQNPYIEEEQTTQWPKENGQKNK